MPNLTPTKRAGVKTIFDPKDQRKMRQILLAEWEIGRLQKKTLSLSIQWWFQSRLTD